MTTPRGSTAVTGLELMTALHPPTRAFEPDAEGRRHPEHNPGSLGKDPVDCAPCEAPDGHPLLKDLPRFHVRGPAEKLFEEAYDWARPMTNAECTLRHLGSTDEDCLRHLTVALPPHYAARLFEAQEQGATEQQLREIAAERLKEV